MKKGKFDKHLILNILTAVLSLTIGILWVLRELGAGTTIIGIALIILGIYFIAINISDGHGFLDKQSLFGFGILVIGIASIIDGLADIILILFPYLLMGVGAAALCEFLFLVLYKKKPLNTRAIILLVAALIGLVIGILMLCINRMRAQTPIILGIILLLFGFYSIADLAIKLNKK